MEIAAATKSDAPTKGETLSIEGQHPLKLNSIEMARTVRSAINFRVLNARSDFQIAAITFL